MKWFGESWGAPVCDPGDRVETPTGFLCEYCRKKVKETDQGVEVPFVPAIGGGLRKRVYHFDCFLRELGIRR